MSDTLTRAVPFLATLLVIDLSVLGYVLHVMYGHKFGSGKRD